MKKKLIALLLAAVMLLGMIPMASAANTMSVALKVTDNSTDLAGTVKIAFYVKGGTESILKGTQSVSFAVDLNVFKLIQKDGTTAGVFKSDMSTALGAKYVYEKYEGDQAWSCSVYGVQSGTTGYFLMQPGQTDGDEPISDGVELASMILGFQTGKTIADVESSSIRLMTATEAKSYNQSSVVYLTDGAKDYIFGDTAATPAADTADAAVSWGFSVKKPALSGTASIARAQGKTGDIMVDEVLTADVTALSDKTNLTYQWQSCATADGTYADISGATAASYTLTNNEIGKYLKVKVTATDASEYSGSVTSAATESKIKGTLSGTPVIARAQGKTGDIMVGEALTADVTALSDKTNLAYQWQSCDTADGTYADISGAIGASYALTNYEVGKYIKVKVTATGDSNYVGDALSASTGKVKDQLDGTVSIEGSSSVNSQLFANLTELSEKTADNLSFQWARCATADGTYADISGATEQIYTLGTDDIGKYVKVKVTATGDSNYVGSKESGCMGPITDRTVTKLEVGYKSGTKATVNYLDGESVLKDQLVVKATFDSGDPDTDFKGYTIDKTNFTGGAANFSGEIGSTVFVGDDLQGAISVGTVKAEYTYDLKQASIADASAAAITDLVYDGQPKNPTPAITYKEKTIQWPEGETNYGFTAEYGENINAYEGEITGGDIQEWIANGAASIKLTGDGNFTGEKTILFNIAKAENPNTKTTLEVGYKYGKAFELDFKDKDINASEFDNFDVIANSDCIQGGKAGLTLSNGVLSGQLVDNESNAGKDVKVTVKAHWTNYEDQTITGIIHIQEGISQNIKLDPIVGVLPVQIPCGEEYLLGEHVTNESPDGSALTYASSNEKVIKVDSESGAVEAVAVGNAEITITAAAIGDYARTSIIVPVKVGKGQICISKIDLNEAMDVTFKINDMEGAQIPENLSVNLNGIYFIRLQELDSTELQDYHPFLLQGAYLEGANKSNYELVYSTPRGNYIEKLATISGLDADMVVVRGDGVSENLNENMIYALPGTRLTLSHKNGGSYNWRTTVDGVQKESGTSATFVIEAPEAGTEKKLSASRASNGGGSGVISIPSNVIFPRIVLTIDSKDADVFGETKANDVAPIIRNNRTMLPARFVAENLGAKVEWNAKARQVTITKDAIVIVLTIGSDKATVNGKTVTLDSPAFIENNRTYTPIRFVAENLGALVEWNEKTRQVYITKLG